MAMVYIQGILDGYHYMFEENTDPRTRGLPLASNLGPLVVILACYLYFCCHFGPKYMKNRKPYQLKYTLVVYNALQVLMSIYLFVGGLLAGWGNHYNYLCQPIDNTVNFYSTAMNKMVWWYYFAKLTELLDTVFFVLRKKDRQITFLHLYHHFSMPIFTYIGLRYYPNGHGTGFGLLNSIVHIVMYTYYLIAGLGPEYQKYIWWKKHVTSIQLVQFVLVFLHNSIPLFTSCTYPKHLHVLMAINAIFFMYMFGNFYIKNYTQKKTDHNIVANGKKASQD